MTGDQLLKNPGPWLPGDVSTDVIVSSRIRLARNVVGAHFPERAAPDELVRLWTSLSGAVQRIPAMQNALILEMASLDTVERDILKERRLISRELAEKGKGSGVVIGADEKTAIMLNEEDHVRLQAIGSGLALESLWEALDAVDTQLEDQVEYAFNASLGYLTACPSNVGTALRASVMMHLPGLRMMNEMDAVIRGLERIGLAVRGVQGEGSEAVGDMFQVSNQGTLGQTEESTIACLAKLATELVQHERNARQRLSDQRKIYLMDQVGRSYGLLLHAHMLSSRDAADMLSALRLGLEFSLVANLTAEQIGKIMLLTQPGHLQRMMGRLMDSEERDIVRAQVVREQLKGLCLVEEGRRRRPSRRRREQARKGL
jgi:protein arginine kinase